VTAAPVQTVQPNTNPKTGRINRTRRTSPARFRSSIRTARHRSSANLAVGLINGASGLARAMQRVAHALERYLGPRLSRFVIARRQREAEDRQAENQAKADAAERAAQQQKFDDELEELRRRAEEEEDEARRRRWGTVTAIRGVAVSAFARASPVLVSIALAAPIRPTMTRRGSSKRDGPHHPLH